MTPEQRRHRADLLAALDGPQPGDDAWQRATELAWGPEDLWRVRRPKRRRDHTAERDQRPSVCPPCLSGHHVADCDGPLCSCRCRVMAGPFPHGDPTAPIVDDDQLIA